MASSNLAPTNVSSYHRRISLAFTGISEVVVCAWSTERSRGYPREISRKGQQKQYMGPLAAR